MHIVGVRVRFNSFQIDRKYLTVHISNMDKQILNALFGATDNSELNGFDNHNITGFADCTGMVVDV